MVGQRGHSHQRGRRCTGGLLVISRDITEVHELECALKVANARNDALIWATSEIVGAQTPCRWPGTGRAGRSSQARATSRGRRRRSNSVHPADRVRVKGTEKVFPRDSLCQRVPASSSRRRMAMGGRRATPLSDEAGRITEWVGIISDIHARRTAEQALRTSEERLRLAIEESRVGIWDVDLDSGERVWSGELREILGLSADEPASSAP